MGQITAEIVGHSLSPQGDELISVLCTFPRIILAEVNTHRMLSKNTSSSRAIPFKKMVESIQNDPFIPIAWQKEHKGMQGTEYHVDSEVIKDIEYNWLQQRDSAISFATHLTQLGVTKQLCNRLLEPFMWTTMLITGPRSGWDNFFNLGCPSYRVGGKGDEKSSTEIYKSKKDAIKDYPSSADEPDINWLFWNEGQAEIHIMDLVEKIYDAFNECTPRQLKAGEWHIPFDKNIDIIGDWESKAAYLLDKVEISTAMAARTSYTVVGEEKDIDYKKMIELHDRLLTQDPPHSSPMEHCARAMNNEEYDRFLKGDINFEIGYHTNELNSKSKRGWCRNFKGFIPYRHIIETK